MSLFSYCFVNKRWAFCLVYDLIMKYEIIINIAHGYLQNLSILTDVMMPARAVSTPEATKPSISSSLRNFVKTLKSRMHI